MPSALERRVVAHLGAAQGQHAARFLHGFHRVDAQVQQGLQEPARVSRHDEVGALRVGLDRHARLGEPGEHRAQLVDQLSAARVVAPGARPGDEQDLLAELAPALRRGHDGRGQLAGVVPVRRSRQQPALPVDDRQHVREIVGDHARDAAHRYDRPRLPDFLLQRLHQGRVANEADDFPRGGAPGAQRLRDVLADHLGAVRVAHRKFADGPGAAGE